ncbi:MAG TPA: hypothetical protein VFO65_02815 [Acidimicrobiales bacterium]|nr:hypothetical protein [Acidimicrobiales bacterium]
MSIRRKLPRASRYADVEQVETTLADGRTVVHLRRRFVPRPETLSTLGHHKVVEGERIDHVAAAAIGDPAAWWQLADANGVSDPEDLVREPEAVLRVTYPEGVRGA